MGRLNLNDYKFAGNVVREPELKQVGDTQLCNLSVAINKSYKTRNGEWKEKTTFMDLVAWRDVATRLAEVNKGDNIFGEGEIVQESWDSEDGTKRTRHKVEVRRFTNLSRSPNRDSDENPWNEESGDDPF